MESSSFSNSSNILDVREQFYNCKLSQFIQKLNNYKLASDEELRDIMSVSSQDLALLKKGKSTLNILQLASLATHLKVSIDNISECRIDFETLIQHKKGNLSYLPERYMLGAESRKSAIVNILNYLEIYYGAELKNTVMYYFQINDSIHHDLDGKVNVMLVMDIYDYLNTRGFQDSDIYKIGVYMATTNKNSWLAEEFSKCHSVKALYEYYMAELIKIIEKNNLYKIIKLTSTTCTFESHEHEHMLDLFKVKHLGNKNRCISRAGTLSAATQYLGLPSASVVEKTCVHDGDSVCTFEINFEHPEKHLSNIKKYGESCQLQ